ncbi:hypothetical protein O1611_g1100 [Lasiodiplodia mahajangana]|uniref:Uncharacterized protein n=1 Tax=Lasiodiplodia mahajangana TaxID=1108764 RepID=A0ACC2JZ93_9PEZI|nr:hypothetical protein O1611_g1100 [Lasiodiplodia mahajangana]
MTLEIRDIDTEVDIPALSRCLFESYENPLQTFFHIFFPTHGTDDQAREAAIKEAAERLKLWYNHDSTSYWQKVVDTATGNIVGGALWNIYEEDPFGKPVSSSVTWFPEGGSRTFAEKAIENHAKPRSKVARQPHIYLFIIFTHPEYRRKGVGQQFIDWGVNKSTEMGLDIYLDSTPYGRPLYEANEFEYIEENVNIPTTENPDAAWKEIEKKVGPFTFWLMRRSVRI